MKNIILLYLFLVILISLRVFSFNLVDDRIFDVLELGIILSVISLHFFFLSIRSKAEKRFNWIVFLMILMPLISSIPAYTEHNQNLYYSLLASRTIFLWLLYFVLHKLKPDKEDLLKLVVIIGFIWAIINIVQQFTYPKVLFISMQAGTGERGVIRIFFRDVRYAVLAFFILYFSILKEFKYDKFGGVLVLFAGILVTGTRQIIFSTLGLSLVAYMLYNRKKINYKMIIGGIAVLLAGIFVLHDFIIGLIMETMEQDIISADYIRIVCAKFFVVDYSDNIGKMLFGNGWDHALSPYGAQINYYKYFKGFYRADIGLFGGYSMFGIFKILVDIVFFIKIFLMRNDEELYFVKIFFVFIAMTSFTGQYFFSYYPSVVLFCFVLYYIDTHFFEKVDNADF